MVTGTGASGPQRGDIWWVDFGEPRGSAPAHRRPVVILQSERFNRSRIATVIVAAISTNLRLSEAPGNVFLTASESGLTRDSVVNVSQLMTVDRRFLMQAAGRLSGPSLWAIDEGLRLVLALD